MTAPVRPRTTISEACRRMRWASAEERFWSRVMPAGECLVWTGPLTTAGYGFLFVDGVRKPAHRYAYESRVGAIPAGLQIDHLCRNRSCVNPTHLEPVTSRDNTLRGNSHVAAFAQRTHCGRGHAFSGDNLYLHPDGRRCCRQCHRDTNRVNARRRRAAVRERRAWATEEER